MIVIKLGELKGIVEGLNEIGEQRLPVKAAYFLSKAVKKIVKEYKTFEENRIRLAMNYSMKDEKGNAITENQQFKFSDEKKFQFQKEFNELCNIEVELNAFPVTISQLGDVQVSVATLMKLEKFIIEDSKPEVAAEEIN